MHLDAVKTRELERRASITSLPSAITDSNIKYDLECEIADLVPEMHQLSLNTKRIIQAWRRGQVPYAISIDLQCHHPRIVENLKTALTTFRRQVASVEWTKHEYEDDYVEFVYDGDGCSSHVGCIGGRQPICLANWAKPGNVLHEMGHAIGLEHEHCRLDRDHFVKIHTDRIKEGKAYAIVEIRGIPFGRYDYNSIMHYHDCAFSKDGNPTIVAKLPQQSEGMGQRKEFSKMDLKGIESTYGPLKCSYEQLGEIYWPQLWYECRTCWGGDSNYGCCLVCALACHSGPDHTLIPHKLSPDSVFVCDCGRNHHQKAVCTWHSTKIKDVNQPFYSCSNCFKNTGESCCYQCMKTCHADHNTTFDGIRKGYCKCGMKCCRITCRIPNPTCSDRCTYKTRGEDYHSQHWYECQTCWGGESNYGCCLSCAFNCHKGHVLVRYCPPEGDRSAVCDCGRNSHQKAVCTWHSTKRKYVKQPFYRCYDCFKGPHEGCCFQCVSKCHEGHNTTYAGIMDAFCDCGLNCCRVSCIIPKPLQCTYETRGEDYHSQRWYECRTCWGGESNYGCCVYCAFNCHKGHKLVCHLWTIGSAFVCDCGRNLHQKAVCTWHSTKTQFVTQPFYRCYDCFKGPHEGCCFQCVSKCHEGHNTRFSGIVDAFCDCGLTCCRVSCSIASPK